MLPQALQEPYTRSYLFSLKSADTKSMDVSICRQNMFF
jgi:hypothetical protein